MSEALQRTLKILGLEYTEEHARDPYLQVLSTVKFHTANTIDYRHLRRTQPTLEEVLLEMPVPDGMLQHPNLKYGPVEDDEQLVRFEWTLGQQQGFTENFILVETSAYVGADYYVFIPELTPDVLVRGGYWFWRDDFGVVAERILWPLIQNLDARALPTTATTR